MSPDRRLRLFIFARILISFLFLASTIILNLQEPKAVEDPSYIGMVRLMAFAFLFSVLSHFFLKLSTARHFITYLQTIWDLLFVTVLLLMTGGVSSPYSFLYLLSIMSAGVLLGRREALHTASLCSILFGAIIDLQYFGYLAPIGLSGLPATQLGPLRVFYYIFINIMGFYVTALITGYLSELARKSEDALREKCINYDELERLSTTIVSHVESGLLTISPEGRIGVFNRYAEELTGRSQAEVYNVPLSSVFPSMAQALETCTGPSQGEFACDSPSHDTMILGYNAIPFTDTHGETAGIIINFKDLTTLKRMELALKQRDRLATLGELSARMAHEIRNPLAAMSGSVQLLAEHGALADSDKRLLTIILREADRLNLLISDFLNYARPASPRKTEIQLRELVEDMRLLLASDQRFSGIALCNAVPADLTISADSDQLRQVLFNLLHNAAEASAQGGCVEIEACDTKHTPGERGPFSVITVTDTGPGLSDEALAHLFEPFWTTKPDGTGLGLAIVYRIIEGHGGTVRAEKPSTGGCRFTILLPR